MPDDLEEVHQTQPHAITIVACCRGDHVKQPDKRILDLTTKNVQIRDGKLGIDIGWSVGSRSPHRSTIRIASPRDKSHLSPARTGISVTRILPQRLVVCREGAVEIVPFDGVVCLLV